MGSISKSNQKRVLCMNKDDLVAKRNDLLKVAEEFKDLPGYERYFMFSGLKGAGVKNLGRYLMEQCSCDGGPVIDQLLLHLKDSCRLVLSPTLFSVYNSS